MHKDNENRVGESLPDFVIGENNIEKFQFLWGDISKPFDEDKGFVLVTVAHYVNDINKHCDYILHAHALYRKLFLCRSAHFNPPFYINYTP
jgi:hypothetical protein